MTRLIATLLILLMCSCNTRQSALKNEKAKTPSAGMEQSLQITVKLLSFEEVAKKFRITAIIQNETGVTSFSNGDTVTLYPNYIRSEGQEINMKSSENEQMTSLQNLSIGSFFTATIKIRGQGNNRYGLVMDWKK